VLLHHYLQGEHKSSEWLQNLFDRKYTAYGNGPYTIGRASSVCALFVVLQV